MGMDCMLYIYVYLFILGVFCPLSPSVAISEDENWYGRKTQHHGTQDRESPSISKRVHQGLCEERQKGAHEAACHDRGRERRSGIEPKGIDDVAHQGHEGELQGRAKEGNRQVQKRYIQSQLRDPPVEGNGEGK